MDQFQDSDLERFAIDMLALVMAINEAPHAAISGLGTSVQFIVDYSIDQSDKPSIVAISDAWSILSDLGGLDGIEPSADALSWAFSSLMISHMFERTRVARVIGQSLIAMVEFARAHPDRHFEAIRQGMLSLRQGGGHG